MGENLDQINIQFSSMDDAGSALIRAFDHGLYSHVDAILPTGSLLGARTGLDGASAAGVQVRPAGYAEFSSVKHVTLPTTPECAEAFYNFMRNQIGKPYDHSAIMGFAFNRDWRTPDSWFCSELIAAALEAAKYFSYDLAAPANKITPADLLLAVSATAPV